jgi:uncharacterized membrane protein YkvI
VNDTKARVNQTFKIAGAFIAWVIGSGFATGQEVLQFFSAYGYGSFGVAAINLIGFITLGYLLMTSGFDHKDTPRFNHFHYFCGKRAGTFYTWLITATLMLLIPVLIAGAGATLYEYYGIDHRIGSAVMAFLVLVTYLIGFERMIRIISSLGPLIIVFSLLVGTITLTRDISLWGEGAGYKNALASYQAAPHWFLSGLLYLELNFFPGSTYFVRLGSTASSGKEIRYGALLGGTILVLSIVVMSTAIVLNGDAIAGLDIPVLYLAGKISYVFGAVFSGILVLGIFSSCSVMMWSVCSRLTFGGRKWNPVWAITVAIATYAVSLLSFGKLIGTIYPMVGYIGLILIGCVLYKGIVKERKR